MSRQDFFSITWIHHHCRCNHLLVLSNSLVIQTYPDTQKLMLSDFKCPIHKWIYCVHVKASSDVVCFFRSICEIAQWARRKSKICLANDASKQQVTKWRQNVNTLQKHTDSVNVRKTSSTTVQRPFWFASMPSLMRHIPMFHYILLTHPTFCRWEHAELDFKYCASIKVNSKEK